MRLRQTLRTLATSPGFTLTTVLTLALAIGANSTVFSAIDAVLLEPLPFPEPNRLVELNEIHGQTDVGNIAPVRVEDWNRLNTTFEAISGYLTENVAETSTEPPEYLQRASVAPRFNEVWGVEPILGRSLVAADHEPGAEPVVLVSDRWWRTHFAGATDVLGKTLRLTGTSYRIVGVMPPSFAFPERDVDVWMAAINFPFVLNRNNAWYQGQGRLRPGVSIEQARGDLARVQTQLAEQYPDTDAEIGIRVDPLMEMTVGRARASLWLLLGAVVVLLTIACTNIAALLLARATRRRQEVGIRLVLGASQWSVAVKLLTEVAVLALAGALLGLGIVAAAPRALRALAPDFPRLDEIAMDGGILLFTLGTVLVVTAFCGVLPAIRSAREPLRGAIADAGRSNVSTRHRVQWLFVGVQVALSVTLLAGAGLLVRSFQELWNVERGFEPSHVLTFRVTGTFAEPFDRLIPNVDSMLTAIRAIPAVEAAAVSSPVPGVLNDGSGFEFGAGEFPLAETAASADVPPVAQGRVVSPTYFETLQIPLLTGEMCRREQGRPTEVMVNRSFATRYLAGRSAPGTRMRVYGTTATIAGIVGDARELGLAREPVPTVYSCTTAVAYPPLAFLVRTTGNPAALTDSIRNGIAEVQPQRSMYDVMPLEQRMGDEYAQNRLRTILLTMFAGTALALTMLGIYGTLSYVVSLRRREIGLRLAIGAAQRDIVAQFVGRALRVVGIAVLAGLVLSLAAGRALASMLFGVSHFDPVALGSVVALVIAVATLAAFVPALRASRIDPMETLREE
jgi:putative ABC transport system permease protein